MEKTKLIAIKDFQSQGKSTTIWLLLFTLVKDLHAEVVRLYDQNREKEMDCLPDAIPTGDDMYDIYAELLWNGHFIVLIGRGDYADRLVGDIRWALQQKRQPNYVVCAIHMRERNRDIWNAFDHKFPNSQYHRIFFWAEKADDPEVALEVKEPTVEAIIKYMA